MANDYSPNRIISIYIDEIQKQMKKMEKKFLEMDFENADAREDMRKIVNDMKSECKKFIGELKAYRF